MKNRKLPLSASFLRFFHKGWVAGMVCLVLLLSPLLHFTTWAAPRRKKTPRTPNKLDSLSSLSTIRRAHRRAPLVDLHADTLYRLMGRWYNLRLRQRRRDLDLPKLRQGGVGAQVFVMWISPRKMKKPGDGWRLLKQMYAGYQRMLRQSRGALVHARTAREVRRIVKAGNIAALLAIEGLHPLEGQLSRIKTLARWGVTYAGLTWNNSNAFASSAMNETRNIGGKGLSNKGLKAIRLLEKHRILVDVSHAGNKTFWDVVRWSRRPFIASHSNAKRLCAHYRNLTDRQIRAIARKGGVIGVNFYPKFLRSDRHWKRASIRDVVKHIRTLARIGGWKTVALGSDFDGIPRHPRGLRHVGRFPYLTRSLLRKGIKGQRLRGLLGQNFLRLLPQ